MLAADFGTGQVLWSLFWFAIFFIWVYLFIIVVLDVFRSHDLSGVAKVLWIAVVLVFPYIGIFAYLIIRGHKMHEHAEAEAAAANAAAEAYIRQAAAGAGTGVAGELERLADLRDNGVITDAEFENRKAKLLQD